MLGIDPLLLQLVSCSYAGGRNSSGYCSGDGSNVFATNSCHSLYKGEWENGVRHGKGNFEWTDGVAFAGSVNNGAISDGSFRWRDGSTYVGEVHNGKRHGIGEFRSCGGGLIYRGEWKMGSKSGRGVLSYNKEGSVVYEGGFIDDERSGVGKMIYPSGSFYEGCWLHNLRHGKGRMVWRKLNTEYDGEWKFGTPNGKGRYTYVKLLNTDVVQHESALPGIPLIESIPAELLRSVNLYDGEVKDGMRHGFGVFRYADGSVYEGEWANNLKEGWGKFTFVNGDMYVGSFSNNAATDQQQLRAHEASNNFFTLFIDDLLTAEVNPGQVLECIQYYVARNFGVFTRLFSHYTCATGPSPEKGCAMSLSQFWRFTKDCKLQGGELSLAVIDRIFTKFQDFSRPCCAGDSAVVKAITARLPAFIPAQTEITPDKSAKRPKMRNGKEAAALADRKTPVRQSIHEASVTYVKPLSPQTASTFARSSPTGKRERQTANMLVFTNEEDDPIPAGELTIIPHEEFANDTAPQMEETAGNHVEDWYNAIQSDNGLESEIGEESLSEKRVEICPPPKTLTASQLSSRVIESNLNPVLQRRWSAFKNSDIHSPSAGGILLRDFVEAIIRIAAIKYKHSSLDQKLRHCMESDIFPNEGKKSSDAVDQSTSQWLDTNQRRLRDIFEFFNSVNVFGDNLDTRPEPDRHKDATLTVRNFLLMCKFPPTSEFAVPFEEILQFLKSELQCDQVHDSEFADRELVFTEFAELFVAIGARASHSSDPVSGCWALLKAVELTAIQRGLTRNPEE